MLRPRKIKSSVAAPDPYSVLNWQDELEPLQAAPHLTPAPAAVSRAALRAQRVLVAGAVSIVVALGIGLAAFICAGFVRRELEVASALALLAGVPLCAAGSRRSNAAVEAAGYKRWPGVVGVIQPGYILEPEGPVALTLCLLLLPVLFLLAVGLTPGVVAARTLFHPAVGTAISDLAPPTCPTCPAKALTTFRTAAGQVVGTRLAGLMGPSSDGVGTAIVYDAHNPKHAMSGSDYARDSAPRRSAQLGFVIAMQATIVAWAMAVTRLRRRAFGDGRARVPMCRLGLIRHARGRDTWRLTYVDGVSVRYPDTVPQRRAIMRRIEDDPGGFHADPEIWRLLTTGGR